MHGQKIRSKKFYGNILSRTLRDDHPIQRLTFSEQDNLEINTFVTRLHLS